MDSGAFAFGGATPNADQRPGRERHGVHDAVVYDGAGAANLLGFFRFADAVLSGAGEEQFSRFANAGGFGHPVGTVYV